MEHVKCLIIGSGPAGYTAAIYAGRANLQPVEYCGMQTGGQLTQTTIVENFPGYPEGVDANQMMMEIREQAERFGCDIRDGEVTAVGANDLLVLQVPETYYDYTHQMRDEAYFYNAANDIVRCYALEVGDVFELSAEVFTGTPVKGKAVSVSRKKLAVAS